MSSTLAQRMESPTSTLNDRDSESKLSTYITFEDRSTYEFEYVSTDAGNLYVEYSKDLKYTQKPVILTFHDVGYNSKSNFDYFFSNPKMKSILEHFSLIQVNALGQEYYSSDMDDKQKYPSFGRLARAIHQIIVHFSVNEIIGLGVGAGANILSRFAMHYPDQVEGLCLVNTCFNGKRWPFWVKGWLSAQLLKRRNVMFRMAHKTLLQRFFSATNDSHELYQSSNQLYYRHHYSHPAFNVFNFSLFLDSLLKRTTLSISRKVPNDTISCSTLLIAGELSDSYDDSVKMFSRLNPQNSSFVRIPKKNFVLRECTDTVAESIQLFLQGLGYIKNMELMNLQGDTVTGTTDSSVE